MKSSQPNFDLRLPSSYLARSYLIATVPKVKAKGVKAQKNCQNREGTLKVKAK